MTDFTDLAIFADLLDDIESTRIRNENRLRALRTEKPNAAAIESVERLAENAVASFQLVEHQITLELQRAMRAHPLGPWAKSISGIGDKQLARFLGQVGDPSWHSRDNRPRKLREWYAYLGLHVLPVAQRSAEGQTSSSDGQSFGSDQGSSERPITSVGADSSGGDAQRRPDSQSGSGVAPRRRKGQQSNWNDLARMRLWLIATSCIKQTGAGPTVLSLYRCIYDDGREQYAAALHAQPCHRCGPAGKPAATGSPLSDAHKHARAIRLVMKAIARDLWLEARRLASSDLSNANGAATPADISSEQPSAPSTAMESAAAPKTSRSRASKDVPLASDRTAPATRPRKRKAS